jgi:hypothetical protein
MTLTKCGTAGILRRAHATIRWDAFPAEFDLADAGTAVAVVCIVIIATFLACNESIATESITDLQLACNRATFIASLDDA